MGFFDEVKGFRLRGAAIQNEWALYVCLRGDELSVETLIVQMATEVDFRVGDDQILATSEEVLIACTT